MDGPLDSYRLRHLFDEDLVEHSLARKLCKGSVAKLDVGTKTALIEMNVLNFAVWAEVLVDEAHDISHCHGVLVVACRVEHNIGDTEDVTVFLKGANSFIILFVRGVASATEAVP